MMHAVKMKLVPADSPADSTPPLIETRPKPPVIPVVSKLSDLDQEMVTILQQSDKSVEEKVNAYHQALQRYQSYLRQYQHQPRTTPSIPSHPVADVPFSPTDMTQI